MGRRLNFIHKQKIRLYLVFTMLLGAGILGYDSVQMWSIYGAVCLCILTLFLGLLLLEATIQKEESKRKAKKQMKVLEISSFLVDISLPIALLLFLRAVLFI